MVINDTPYPILSSRLNVLIICLVFISLSLCALVCLKSDHKEEMWSILQTQKTAKQPDEVFDFSLFSSERAFPLSEFDHAVRPIAVNTRPDADPHQMIGLAVEGKELFIPLGKKTQVTSLLSMVPRLKNEGLDLEVGVSLGNIEKKSHFHFDHLAIHETIAPSSSLKEAFILGPDLLIEHYGGEDFAKMKGKMRMILNNKDRFYLETGDIFSFVDDQWQKGLVKDVPIARLDAVSTNGVELTLWDALGTRVEKLHLGIKTQEPIVLKPDQLFTAVRKRTKACTSLKVMNRQMVLKKGDWLIKTAKGWHTVRTEKELTALLNDECDGELFVFDGFDNHAFTGTLYSPKRVTSLPVHLPIQGKKP